MAACVSLIVSSSAACKGISKRHSSATLELPSSRPPRMIFEMMGGEDGDGEWRQGDDGAREGARGGL